jgi:hypothetical protein
MRRALVSVLVLALISTPAARPAEDGTTDRPRALPRPFPLRVVSIRDLGLPPGGIHDPDETMALNDRGWVVATDQDVPEVGYRGLLWAPGKGWHPLIYQHGGTAPHDLNNRGGVVLKGHNRERYEVLLRWRAGRWSELRLYNAEGDVEAINNRGVAVGRLDSQPALWRGREPYPLSRSEGGAYDINDDNVAVGLVRGASGTRAVVWAGGTTRYLFGRPFPYSEASRINGRGDIAGLVRTDTSIRDDTPFLRLRSGKVLWPERLATRNYIAGLNNARVMVGAAGSSLETPCIWHRTRAVDPNDILPPTSNWTLLSVSAVNEKNEVAGYGLNSGALRFFVMKLAKR